MDRVPVTPGRYLLLGASGLIGSHLLRPLVAVPGVEVRAVSRRRTSPWGGANVEVRHVDLTCAGALADCMEGVDVVVHAAGEVASAPVLARDPLGRIRRNIAITQEVFAESWRQGIARVVWISTTTGYPESLEPLREEEFFCGQPPASWARLRGRQRERARSARNTAGTRRFSGFSPRIRCRAATLGQSKML